MKGLIGQSIDAIIQISRMRNGSRKVTHISLIDLDKDGLVVINDIYRYTNHRNKNGEMEFGFIRTNQELTQRMIEKFSEAEINPLRFKASGVEQ